MNFNDHKVTWDTNTIPMKGREAAFFHHWRPHLIYLSTNEPQTLRDENSRATNILNAEYKLASSHDAIKTCENLHVDEQHQLEILLKKYEYVIPV
jgi:hypothetical protein